MTDKLTGQGTTYMWIDDEEGNVVCLNPHMEMEVGRIDRFRIVENPFRPAVDALKTLLLARRRNATAP